jgi:hypothetical protein
MTSMREVRLANNSGETNKIYNYSEVEKSKKKEDKLYKLILFI